MGNEVKWCRRRYFSIENCQSNLGKRSLARGVDPMQAHKNLGRFLVILKKPKKPNKLLVTIQEAKRSFSLTCTCPMRLHVFSRLATHDHAGLVAAWGPQKATQAPKGYEANALDIGFHSGPAEGMAGQFHGGMEVDGTLGTQGRGRLPEPISPGWIRRILS